MTSGHSHHDHGPTGGETGRQSSDGAQASPAKPRRQEQEPASDEITEVAAGILRSELPISIPGLGHVNCYLIEDERGFAVVDPGLPDKDSYRALTRRLGQAGVPISRVHTIVVTHSHPDHFGGAARLRADSGAEIVTHRRFRVLWDPSEPPDVDLDTAAAALTSGSGSGSGSGSTADEKPQRRLPWEPTPWGGQGMDVPWQRRAWVRAARVFPKMLKIPRPTVRLDDSETIRLAGRQWVAVHTPGHTEDHLCLFDPETGTMLSGDHVLPTITPHISGLIRAKDPLAEFFASLDKIGTFADRTSTVLPAHGRPFTDLAGRVEAIKRHHHERLDIIRRVSNEAGAPTTVMEFSKHLFSPRSQGTMADSETFAHLEHLRLAGEAIQSRNGELLEYLIG